MCFRIFKFLFLQSSSSRKEPRTSNTKTTATPKKPDWFTVITLIMCFVCVCVFSSHQSVQEMGNAKAKRLYEAFLPKCFQRPETDQSAEIFIRDKYDKKKYMDKVIDIQMLRVSPRAQGIRREVSGACLRRPLRFSAEGKEL